MKKLLFSALIVTTTTLVPTLPSLAKDCPSIPTETKEVTVKDDDATLRTEPKKSSDKGSQIVAGDKLKIIDNKPTQDSEGNDYCWYKVKLLKGSDAKQYWIADIGLVEFSSWQQAVDSKSNSSDSFKNNQDKKDQDGKGDFLMPWLIWLLSVIPTVILSVVLFKKIQDERTEREKCFKNSTEKLEELETQQNKLQSMVTQQNSKISKFDEAQTKLQLMVIQQNSTISKFEEAQIKKEEHFNNSIIEKNSEIIKQNSTVIKSILGFIKPFKDEDPQIVIIDQDDKKEWKNLVNEFNKRDFTDRKFKFLKLNTPSVHGKSNLSGSTIVQLVPAEGGDASYLKIEADQENWLFPNIFSGRVDQIISLETPIFTNESNLNNPQLKKPAKLKLKDPVSEIEIWEIAEPGEFI